MDYITSHKMPILNFFLILLATVLVIFIIRQLKSPCETPTKPIGPIDPQKRFVIENNVKYPIIHYLSVLYPLVTYPIWNKMADKDLIAFYLNLNWFYFPLVYPLPSAWYDYSQQIGTWANGLRISPLSKFLYWPSLGFDLGEYGIALSGNLRGLNAFGCSVFGGKSTWHSEWNKQDHGKTYQNLSFIRPWSAQRYGVPNYSYIETQTYVCEEIGRASLSAPDCSNVPPIPEELLQRYCAKNACTKKIPEVTECDDTMYWCPGKPVPGLHNKPLANLPASKNSSRTRENFANAYATYKNNNSTPKAKPSQAVCVAPPSVDCLIQTTDWSKPSDSCKNPDGTTWTPDMCKPGTLSYKDDTVTTCFDFETGFEGKNSRGQPICQNGSGTGYCSLETTKFVGGNVCVVPLSLWNYADESSGKSFGINGVQWQDYLKSKEKSLGYGYAKKKNVKLLFSEIIRTSQPFLVKNKSLKFGSNCAKLAANSSCVIKTKPTDNSVITPNGGLVTPQKFMAYWMKGYGKFCNMGKTGVYYSFVHFLLTCPKVFTADGPAGDAVAGASARSNPIAILAAQGNMQYTSQLTALASGEYRDPRKTIQGFVTLFRKGKNNGLFEELPGGEPIPNTIPFKTENVNGKLNPLDDDFLKEVDGLTVAYYYPTPVTNPNYGKSVSLTPYKALILFMAFNLNGDSGSDCPGDLLDPKKADFCGVAIGKQPIASRSLPWINGNGLYPFGLYFPGSNIGSTCYAFAYNFGWDSLQLTQMPTGAGRTQYCTTSIADYELVFLRSTKETCQKYYFTVDISQDMKNYSEKGYVQGAATGGSYDENIALDKKKGLLKNIDAVVMPLTERNMRDGSSPNSWFYPEASVPVKAVVTCPYEDKIVSLL